MVEVPAVFYGLAFRSHCRFLPMNALSATDGLPALAVENLHKSFGANEVLKGISLTAHGGDVVVLLGASGSGKSTCLRCINLLEWPNQGVISVRGEAIELRTNARGQLQPVNPKQLQRLRAQLGMVFQHFYLWSHFTILQNLIEGPIQVLKRPRKQAIAEAEALLQKVGLYEKRHEYPAYLSGGQQQRAAIARALAMDPAVLLFDEPTSALDPELVGEVLSVMRKLAEEGRTMVVVTHELGFAREVATDVVFLHQGRIDAQGAPAEIFANPPTERCRQFLQNSLKNK